MKRYIIYNVLFIFEYDSFLILEQTKKSKQRTLELALSYLCSCRDILEKLLKQSNKLDKKDLEELQSLSYILLNRLQAVLLEILRIVGCQKR